MSQLLSEEDINKIGKAYKMPPKKYKKLDKESIKGITPIDFEINGKLFSEQFRSIYPNKIKFHIYCIDGTFFLVNGNTLEIIFSSTHENNIINSGVAMIVEYYQRVLKKSVAGAYVAYKVSYEEWRIGTVDDVIIKVSTLKVGRNTTSKYYIPYFKILSEEGNKIYKYSLRTCVLLGRDKKKADMIKKYSSEYVSVYKKYVFLENKLEALTRGKEINVIR